MKCECSERVKLTPNKYFKQSTKGKK
jgi:hypothetical protein